MKALVLGFDPFAGDEINPAAEAVARLPSALGPLAVERRIVPTRFGQSRAVMQAAVEALGPDLVLGVGQAGGRSALSLERVAINLDDARIADNAGQQPIDSPIVAAGPAAYFSTLPIKAAVAALRRAGLPAEISNTAGTFVCNHLFYGMMHRAERDGFRAGFLHVPWLPQQAARLGGGPSMALEHIAQGIEIILAVAAGQIADIHGIEGRIS
jgi:pyroglutamyl-peptidase